MKANQDKTKTKKYRRKIILKNKKVIHREYLKQDRK